MHKLDNKIIFTKEEITGIYNNYSKLAFCDAIRFLIKNDLLDDEDKIIVLKATSAATKIPNYKL